MNWHVFKNRKDAGIIESNLPQAVKHFTQRANTYDTEKERFHTYQLVPVAYVRARFKFRNGRYTFWNDIAPDAVGVIEIKRGMR